MIIVLVVVDLIIVGIVVGQARDHDLTIKRIHTVDSFYATEAGINMAFRELTYQRDEDGDGTIGTISDDSNDANDPTLGTAQFLVTDAVVAGQTTLTSRGRSGATRRSADLLADGNVSNSAAWWNGAWGQRRKLPFDNAAQTENLTDFPVLVSLTSDRIDYAAIQNAGEDIRFIDTDGLTELTYEIESWDESGTSYVWVKVPQIDGSSNSDYIWIYYDNIGAADNQDAPNVWTNGYSGVWHLKEDPTAGGGPWYDPSWLYRKKITIDSTKVTATLTNFPVLVSFTDADIKAGARADGFDILFTDSDEVTKLDHEIERWDSATGELIAWVRVPSLPDTTDKDLYVYYGNATASDQQNVTGVWDVNFKAVLHMDETVTDEQSSGTHQDSTSNNNDGGQNNNDDSVAQIGTGQDFDGSSDRVVISDNASLDNTGTGFTVSAWIQPDFIQTNASDRDVVDKWGSSAGWRLWFKELKDDFKFKVRPGGGTTATITTNLTWTAGTPHFLVGTYDGTNVRIYWDGVQENSKAASGTLAANNADVSIGVNSGTSNGTPFDGDIDEVRISDAARSAGWILTEYNNQSDPPSFYTVGPEEQDTGGGPFTDSTVSANAGTPGGSMTALDQVAGQVNGSLDFDGSDDYVGMSGFNATLLPATLTAWVNSDVSLSCSGVVFSRGTAVSGMNVGACSNAFVLGYTWNDAANTYNWTGGPTVPTGEWVLAVLVVEATQATATVYSGSGMSSAINVVAHASSVIDDLKIAQDDAGGRFFDGGIDEVRVSSVARSADWNAAQYKSMADDFILWTLPVLKWQETEP